MKKVILAPDSFKGTLSAREVCAIEAEAVRRVLPDAEAVCLPLSDGGEGLVEAVLGIVPGARRRAEVRGPFGEPVEAAYGVLPDGTAVLEMAAAAGLPLAGNRLRPLEASTFGVGQLLVRAAEDGAGRVLLGLGGSCTNDCGAGMAAALGYRFLDESGAEVPPLAKNLGKIRRIVPPETPLEVELLAACDVDNPLLGERGATYTFGPQKGADAEALALLEAGMRTSAAGTRRPCPARGRRADWGPCWRLWARGWPPARNWCWRARGSTASSGARTWCSPARGVWTGRAPAARWSGRLPGTAGRRECPARRCAGPSARGRRRSMGAD